MWPPPRCPWSGSWGSAPLWNAAVSARPRYPRTTAPCTRTGIAVSFLPRGFRVGPRRHRRRYFRVHRRGGDLFGFGSDLGQIEHQLLRDSVALDRDPGLRGAGQRVEHIAAARLVVQFDAIDRGDQVIVAQPEARECRRIRP